MIERIRTAGARGCWAVALFLSICGNNLAQKFNAADLAEISIEDLMNVQVTSVSKREQTLSSAGAAAYVITQEDIRHSGMTNIPDWKGDMAILGEASAALGNATITISNQEDT